MNHHRTIRRAFTLIELLVVVAIITALLAILLPSLNRAVSTANGAVCGSNLKQMQTLLLSYAFDNHRKVFDYMGAELFITPLSPYAADIDAIRFCPSTTEPASGGGTALHAWTYSSSQGVEKGSYGFNGFMYGTGVTSNTGGKDWFPGTPIGDNFPKAWAGSAMPAFASEFPTFFDCMWVDAWPHHDDLLPPDYYTGQQGANYPRQMQRLMLDRHDMAVNLVYADGHAARVPLSMLYDQRWSNIFERQGEIALP